MKKQIKILAVFIYCSLHAAVAAPNTIDFYGKLVEVNTHSELQSFAFSASPVSYTKINNQLKAMHALDLDATFQELENRGLELNLDELGYFQLLKVFSMQGFPSQTSNFRIALVWYGLRHRGIDAILAGKVNYLNLFVRMAQETDGGFSMTHQGKKYQSVTKGEIPYKTLEVFKPMLLQDSAYGEISLNVNKLPKLGKTIVSREREFSYGTTSYTLKTRYNSNLVDYLNDLPRFRIGAHLYQLSPSKEAANSLDDSIKIWTKNMGFNEKQGFLLTLVQEAFAYKADRDYRPQEKRNFIEQTLADDYVDCEDKAAFYCYLAKKYLNTNTILIYSKDMVHVNCALEMQPGAPGYTFKYKNKPYLICEPAYFGYKPGETDMRTADIQKAEIIEPN